MHSPLTPWMERWGYKEACWCYFDLQIWGAAGRESRLCPVKHRTYAVG